MEAEDYNTRVHEAARQKKLLGELREQRKRVVTAGPPHALRRVAVRPPEGSTL